MTETREEWLETFSGCGFCGMLLPEEIEMFINVGEDKRLPSGHILEIGTNTGATTAGLSRANDRRDKEEMVVSLDPYPGKAFSCAVRLLCAANATLYSKNVIAMQCSLEQLQKVFGNRRVFRMIFIDGDHSYDASKKDYELAKEMLVPNGIIIFHDTTNEIYGVKDLWNELTKTLPIQMENGEIRISEEYPATGTCKILRWYV